jgi:hypothetical protein
MLAWIVIVTLAAIAGYDLYRNFKKQKTLSQLYWPLLPQWADATLMCVTVGVAWWLLSEQVAAWIMVGCMLGHLCWKDTSK